METDAEKDTQPHIRQNPVEEAEEGFKEPDGSMTLQQNPQN